MGASVKENNNVGRMPDNKIYDVLIIGGGVIGCCIARELSKRQIRIAVAEKASDIGEGASKANSGIVHAGFDARTGTLKALLNVRGNHRMKELAEELDFPYRNNGSLVLCFEQENQSSLNKLLNRGKKNGVAGLRILTGEEVRSREPAVSKEVISALYAPSGGIVCPFGLTVAMAENAAANGVEFYRDTEVTGIRSENGIYHVNCREKSFASRIVINAAGVYADEIHNMVSAERMRIIPRRGEYLLFDKNVGNTVSHTLFQMPTAYGKGVLVTPTVHGNLMMGPTAEDIPDKEGINTTGSGLNTILQKAGKSIGRIPEREVITSFAGLRANSGRGDFVIGEVKDAPGFIDVAGIDSPGLSSAPAIGEYVAELIQTIYPAEIKNDFIKNRKGIQSGTGEIICRCETVTREAIIEAIRRTPGAVSLDGVKRRTRAGMGRCQSGFCSPKVVEILAQELGKEKWEITKSGKGSEILMNQEVSG